MPIVFSIVRVTFFTFTFTAGCSALEYMVLDLFFLNGVVLNVHVKHTSQLHLNECYRGFHRGALFLVQAYSHSVYSLADLGGHRSELGVNG